MGGGGSGLVGSIICWGVLWRMRLGGMVRRVC